MSHLADKTTPPAGLATGSGHYLLAVVLRTLEMEHVEAGKCAPPNHVAGHIPEIFDIRKSRRIDSHDLFPG